MSADEPRPTPSTGPSPAMAVVAADGRAAALVLAGEIGAGALRDLAEFLDDPRLGRAAAWDLDLSGVTHLDLACGYALLRAVTLRPEPVALTIHGARRSVQRTLRSAGLDAVADIGGR
ncbi:STAS domain-containing protein [Streptomyces sp. NPDC049916]|uniref:STAS domain-containing protein n=1 Tax=Streptomyces sp. NPDC049916 TaxID=3155156 RepID=UPI003449DB75